MTSSNTRLKRKAEKPLDEPDFKPDKDKKSKITGDPANFLPNSQYQAIECGGAGNCLFLSICFQIGQSKPRDHLKLRQETCDYMQDHLNDYARVFEYVNDPSEYIDNVRKSGEWGGHPEINALSKILERTIRIYESRHSGKKLLGFILKTQEINDVLQHDPILLHHIPEYHYQAITPQETILVEIDTKKSNRKDSNENKDENRDMDQHQKDTLEEISPESPFDAKIVAKRQVNQKYPLRAQFCDFYQCCAGTAESSDILRSAESADFSAVP